MNFQKSQEKHFNQKELKLYIQKGFNDSDFFIPQVKQYKKSSDQIYDMSSQLSNIDKKTLMNISSTRNLENNLSRFCLQDIQEYLPANNNQSIDSILTYRQFNKKMKNNTKILIKKTFNLPVIKIKPKIFKIQSLRQNDKSLLNESKFLKFKPIQQTKVLEQSQFQQKQVKISQNKEKIQNDDQRLKKLIKNLKDQMNDLSSYKRPFEKLFQSQKNNPQEFFSGFKNQINDMEKQVLKAQKNCNNRHLNHEKSIKSRIQEQDKVFYENEM